MRIGNHYYGDAWSTEAVPPCCIWSTNSALVAARLLCSFELLWQSGRYTLFVYYWMCHNTGNWAYRRPIWLVLLLNTLTKTSLKQNGVVILDRYMADRASNMGNKAVLGIESPEENCATLNNLNATYVSVPQRHVCVMPTSHYRSHGSRAALIGGAEWPAHLLALLSHMLLC